MKENDPIEIKPTAAYTRDEAAQGLRLSPRQVDYLVKSGELGASKLGRSVRILGRDLLDMLQRTRIHK